MRPALFAAILTGLAPAVWASTVQAQVESVSAGPERAAVVIYRDRPVDTADLMARSGRPWERLDLEGLALVVETRTIDLPAGEAVIRLRGVASGIVPQTATLDGLPADIVERNTDFDLLSPGSLLQRSVGEVVRVVRTNPATGERVVRPAVVRSGPAGVVLEVDGRLEALNCSGLTERIIFDRVPDGLGDQPVLSVRTRAPEAGRYTVTLAYLATGLQWSADYVARVRPDGRSLDLTGWITLANFGGSSFPNAPVQVVAGTLNRDDDTVPVQATEVVRAPSCWPQDTTTAGPGSQGVIYPAPTRAMARGYAGDQTEIDEIVVTGSRVRRANLVAQQGELGDYKIYTLPNHTDVLARQTKQVRFLEQENVRFTRLYVAEVMAGDDAEPRAPRLVLRLRNERRQGLGVPLPGGGVSLMETPDGAATLFAGQTRFEDRGVGLPVDLSFGEAMGLTVSQEAEDKSSGDLARWAVRVTVRNDKSEAAEVEISPAEWRRRNFRLLNSSEASRIGDGGYPVWTIRLRPGQERVLSYTVESEG